MLYPLFTLFLDDLSFGESRILTAPTIIVLESICNFKFNSVSFMKVCDSVFAAHMCRILLFG